MSFWGKVDVSEKYLSFRHFLYLTIWVGTLVIIVKGDFAAIPRELQDEAAGAFWVWGGLTLWATPTAILSDYLIHRSPPCKYRAMWLRMGADVGQFVSILVYMILRFYTGDYHVYSTSVLFAALGYVGYLALWDINQLIGVERLASRLEKKDV
jgi:hypothetical protein